jgi:CPA1 family monovalent cation:H+ antiporter
VLLLLLIVVAGFAVLAERVKVPYPIVLLLAGLGLSLIPHVPRVALNPEVVFLVFLPPLLYRAAWMTSWREFQRNLVSITMLAVGLVAFTAWGVAEFADHFIAALDWRSGFVLGAVVATTDALAATAIAKRVGLPKQILDLLEGESMMNDATGLLVLEFAVRLLVHGESPTMGMAALKLAWMIVGGLGMGLIVGCVVVWCERHIDDGPVEIVVSVIAAYASYLLGERIGASGVLSVVACGLYVSRKSGAFFSPQVRLQAMSVWEALDFALNGVVFCLMGLQLPYVLAGIRGYSWQTLMTYGLVFSGALIVLRLVWMYPGAWVAWKIRTLVLKQAYERPAAKGIFVVGWTGMRGVIALAAAVSLPNTLANGEPFAQRDLIVFLTFCVILVTLVGQGLTLPALIRRLGLVGGSKELEYEEKVARRAAIAAGGAWLREQRELAENEEKRHLYDDLLHQYEHKQQAVYMLGKEQGTEFTEMMRIAQGALQAERRVLLQMQDEGRVGDETVREVERELDLSETRIDVAREKFDTPE